MKNKVIYHVALALLAGGVFASCTREVEDIFDVPGAQRLQEAMTEIEQTLVAAPNGWEMRYYTQPETAGYVMLIKFDANGSAMVAAKNSVTGGTYRSDVSTWEVIGDDGPVITFNSYNEVMHAFSDPQNDGVGLGGDYEFRVQETTDSHLVLKGKKTDAYIDMYALNASVAWEAHLDELLVMDSYLFNNLVDLELRVNGAPLYTLYNTTSHIFGVLPYGEENFDLMEDASFVVTSDGLMLYEAFEVDGQQVRTFKLNESRTELVSQEVAEVVITAPDVYEYFQITNSNYLATKENITGNFVTAYDALAAGLIERYEDRQMLQSVGFSSANGQPVWVLRTGRSTALFRLPGEVKDGELVVDAFDANNFPTDNMDDNARLYYQNVPAVKEFLATLPGTYTLESRDAFTLNAIFLSGTNGTMLMQR